MRRTLFFIAYLCCFLSTPVNAGVENQNSESGTLANPIVDSAKTLTEALDGVHPQCPPEVLQRQILVDVRYYSFDGKIHKGQVVIDERLAGDIRAIFDEALHHQFPLASVIPIADKQFRRNGRWDDDLSMLANNTSAFNYREVTGGQKLSNHATGWAIDINPLNNPYIKGDHILPPGAQYKREATGTLTDDHPVVRHFLSLGWSWGGHWKTLKDYQHFEKIPE